MICAKSGQNWPRGSGEEVENVKVYKQTDGKTDRRRTTGDQKSSLELKTVGSSISMNSLYKGLTKLMYPL
jgi:hypothetical protein